MKNKNKFNLTLTKEQQGLLGLFITCIYILSVTALMVWYFMKWG